VSLCLWFKVENGFYVRLIMLENLFKHCFMELSHGVD